MYWNRLCYKRFFGTSSQEQAQKIYQHLEEAGIRCSFETISGTAAAKFEKIDLIHFYPKHYLKNLDHFYLVMVHMFDLQKASFIYQSSIGDE